MYNKKDFIKHKEATIKYINKKGFSTSNVGEFSTLTGIPLTVVYEFIIDELPQHKQECIDKINSIDEFYGDKGRLLL